MQSDHNLLKNGENYKTTDCKVIRGCEEKSKTYTTHETG